MNGQQMASEELLQLVIFKIGKEEFGAPITQVKEIIALAEITRMPQAPPFIEGVINLRGQVIAVVDLAKRFGLAAKERDDNTRIMVVEVGPNTMGMIVDSVVEVMQLPKENINPTPSLVESKIKTDFIEGIGQQEDRLFILLDLGNVLTTKEMSQQDDMVS